MLQPSNHFMASSGLDPSCGCSAPGGSQQSRAEWQNPLPALLPTLLWVQPSTCLALWAVSAMAGSCPASHPQHPQVLLGRAALICPSPACVGIQIQHLAHDLVKTYKFSMGPLLKLLQVPSLRCISYLHVYGSYFLCH